MVRSFISACAIAEFLNIAIKNYKEKSRQKTLFLLKKGVKVVRIDVWTWDRPVLYLAKEFQATKDPKVIWEAHFAGVEIGYCHMEKRTNRKSIGLRVLRSAAFQ